MMCCSAARITTWKNSFKIPRSLSWLKKKKTHEVPEQLFTKLSTTPQLQKLLNEKIKQLQSSHQTSQQDAAG